MNTPLVPFMLMLSDMNRAHAREVEQLRLDDQCEGALSAATTWLQLYERSRQKVLKRHQERMALLGITL